jgi:hypothetical protein
MAYATLAEVRALDRLDDSTVYPDALLEAGIAWAEAEVDLYCGTSFTYKSFTVTGDGDGSAVFDLLGPHGPIIFPQTVTTATVDGVVVADTSGWVLYPVGYIVRDSGTFTVPEVGRNVTIVGTAGYSASPPDAIAWATRTLARQYALDHRSRVPGGALQLASEFGTVQLAQAGGPWRPFSLPEVNAVLNRYRFRPPTIG